MIIIIIREKVPPTHFYTSRPTRRIYPILCGQGTKYLYFFLFILFYLN